MSRQALRGALALVAAFCAAAPALASGARASLTRANDTTTYTANTAWNNAKASGSIGLLTFTLVCGPNSNSILIPQIDVYSSANPATKLQGLLWLFTAKPAILNDNAAFTLAAGDYANLTGNIEGFPFTLTDVQSSGAANSGVSLTGTVFEAHCQNGVSSTLYGEIQVVNAYVPAAQETLTVKINTVGNP